LSFGHIHLLPILFPPLHVPVSLLIFLHSFLINLVPLGQLHLLFCIFPPLQFSLGFTQSPFNNSLSFGHIHLLPILFPPLHVPVSLIIFLHSFLKNLVPLGQLHLLYSILPPLQFSLGFTQSPNNNTLSFGHSQ